MTYSPIQGLLPEEGVVRRDPSDIFKRNGTYFVYYTRSEGKPLRAGLENATDKIRAYPWDLADIWLATSKDGIHWDEQGVAVSRGSQGAYDARSVFTPNILVDRGRFYLFYQTAPDLSQGEKGDFAGTRIGMSWADSPYGPWTKAEEPVLGPGEWGDPGNYPDGPVIERGEWDAKVVHDPSVIVQNGTYFLYYKSRYFRGPYDTFINGDMKNWVEKEGGIPIGWGTATADNPKGPYVKSPYNPVLIGGHECIVWPYNGGICALLEEGPERNTVQFASDGFNFHPIGAVKEAPVAAGIFRADFSDHSMTEEDNARTWGLSHVVQRVPWHHLRRFEFDEPIAQ